MIDSAAEALARRILVAFPPSTARTRADIERIPVPVGRLLAAELDARADRFAALPVSEWVDREDERLAEARGAWRQAVRAAAHFPANVWEEAVAQAARLAVSHLVRPAETAAADAFADADGLTELPIGTALARVRVFGAYGYLPEIAARYAERKGIADIDRPGLERLLRRIDRRMVEDFGPDEWTTLAGPLYDLVGMPATPEATVGVGLLRALFEAKGRHEVARTLISDTYTREALHTHLVAVMPRPDAATPDAPTAPAPSPTEVASTEPAPEASASTRPAPVEPDTPPGDALAPELPHAPELERLTLPDTSATEPTPPDAAAAEVPQSAAEAPSTDRPSAADLPRDAAPSSDRTHDAAAAREEPSASTGPEPDGTEDAASEAPAATLLAGDARAEPASPDPASPQSPDSAAAPTEATPADADEPLWKRMLQRPEADLTPERPLAATTDPDLPDEPDPPAPFADGRASGPAEPEPLWRRFAAAEPLAEPDDEDGWAVAPTLAATSTAALPDTPLPPQTLAGAFARQTPLPPPEAAVPDEVSEGSGVDTDPNPDGPMATASLDAVERTVLGSGPADRREWFVNTLFEASAEDYHATLDALSAASSWTAATQIIASEVFRKHRVNIYSEAAIAFTDAVEAQIEARS